MATQSVITDREKLLSVAHAAEWSPERDVAQAELVKRVHRCAECRAELSPEHQAELAKLCDEDQRRAPKQCEACWRKADKGDDTYEFPEHTEY